MMNWKLLLIFYIMTLVSSQIPADESEKSSSSSKNQIRDKRAGDPWGFFTTIFEAKRIHREQTNDTEQTLRNIYDLVADTFSDTYTTQKTLISSSEINSGENSTTSTTTEKYRVSRAELGRILRRNQIALQRLLKLELNDAFNQSAISLAEYKAWEKTKFSRNQVN